MLNTIINPFSIQKFSKCEMYTLLFITKKILRYDVTTYFKKIYPMLCYKYCKSKSVTNANYILYLSINLIVTLKQCSVMEVIILNIGIIRMTCIVYILHKNYYYRETNLFVISNQQPIQFNQIIKTIAYNICVFTEDNSTYN